MKNEQQKLQQQLLEDQRYLQQEKKKANQTCELDYMPPEIGSEEEEKQQEDGVEEIMMQQEKDMTKEQKVKKDELMNRFHAVQSQLMQEVKFFKEDRENKIVLDNPIMMEIKLILDFWEKRNRRSDKFFLHLHLTNCTIKLDLLKQIFIVYPSIKLFVNEQPINQGGILKIQGDSFYEGTQKFMTILNKKQQYQGSVQNFKPHGEGQLVQNMNAREGFFYRGQFFQGKMHGKGVMQSNNGISYKGDFKENVKQGQGQELVFTNRKKKNKPGQDPVAKQKSAYKGAFKAGVREGEGTEQTSHGTYTGDWKDNMKEGYGQMMYKNGDYYKGNWQRDQFSGQGQYYENENCKYNGQFLHGKYHGNGTMTYNNGDKYQGEYEFGKKHGNGKYDWEDQDYYDGQWRFDSAQGHGTSMIGEEFYDGDFKNGKKHGQGECTTPEGDIIRGIWDNNELVKKIEVNGELVQD